MKTYFDLVNEAKPRVRLVSANDAEQALKDAELLIDVREESEYAAGHLPGAVHMSRGVIEAKLGAEPRFAKPEMRIVRYCRTDARATLVADALQKMGYAEVQVLAGGYESWRTAGHPVMTVPEIK